MSREFANGPGDWGSIPTQVIPKTQKMVLDAALLNTQHYKVSVKWSNPGNGVAPYPTPRCGSYWKGNPRFLLDWGRQLSSLSCHAASTDIPDPLSPPVSVIHRSLEVFKATSCINTELLYIGSSWSSCLCSSMWRGPQEYVGYEFGPYFPSSVPHVWFV